MVMLRKILMALATRAAKFVAIFDPDLAAVIFYQARPLQFLRYGADAGAANAHHLGEKFLCERKIVACHSLHASKPFARAFSDLMHCIAGSCLLCLRQDE